MKTLFDGAKADLVPIILILIFVGSTAMVRTSYGLPTVSAQSYFTNYFVMFSGTVIILIAVATVWLVKRLVADRPEGPINYIATHKDTELFLESLVRTLVLLLIVCLFLPNFGSLKSMVGLVRPYIWDATFVRWDYFLHGQDVWKLLHPFVGYPVVTFGLAILYHLWVLLIYLAFPLICVWHGKRLLRQQMIIAYILCWIVLGVIAAHWLASVGPCFLHPVVGDARFLDQMAYLEGVDKEYPILVLDVQKQLLESYFAGNQGLGRGISAMPSMHVSIAFLFTLFGWNISRAVGLLATTFFVAILIGSVHLGYHYAVDGYVSIVATATIWWLAGIIARQWTGPQSGGEISN